MTTERASKKTIADVAFEQGRQFADDPNITAVGYGVKLRDGAPVGAESLVFFVRRKLDSLPAIEENGTRPVPAEIEGFGTDVVEIGLAAAASADRSPAVGDRGARIADPLVGGVATTSLGSTRSGPGGYGTLGGLCFDTATGAPLLLSNAHVWGRTALTEVVQPVTAKSMLGASVSPAVVGDPSLLVQTRIPPALVAATAFANSISQTYLMTAGASDPLSAGQAASPMPPLAKTTSELVTINGPIAGLPPAGVRLTPTVAWTYQRLADSAVVQNGSNTQRSVSQLLGARRLFTDAPSYASGQSVKLYAEIIPAVGASPSAAAHFVLALLYPLASGDKLIPRILRPTARQTVTTVTTSFAGFSAPARLGPVPLPAVAGAFAVDAAQPGTFVVPPAGAGLPAGTFVLKLPAGGVRIFVPSGTQVIIDIDLTGSSGPLGVTAVNSARDTVSATVTSTAGTASRTLLTIAASEIVEVALTGVANAQLFGVTSKRASPESAPPLCYSGVASSSAFLPKGKWGASLFVQATDSGAVESANIVETAIGFATLIADCSFDIT